MNIKRRDYLVATISVTAAFFLVSFYSESIRLIAKEQIATVSQFGATVEETPTNKMAANLREYSNQLSERENQLNQREAALNEEAERVRNSTRNILIGSISLSLITLLIINLYLSRRNKKITEYNYNTPKFAYSKIHIPRVKYHIDVQ